MGLTVHFEVLNQLGTPMMYSATLANRPAAGIAGRIFFRTDSPFGIFRDTGSAWDQIGSAGGGNTIYTGDDTLTGNRTVSSGGFTLTFTPQTTFFSSLIPAVNASSFAVLGSNTLTYAAGFSSNNIGNVYSANGAINTQVFSGNATFAQANLASAMVNVNSIDFSSGGHIVTMTQSTGIRAMAGVQNQIQFQGSHNGTISHAAVSQNLGFYRPPSSTRTLTITNAYSHLINALDDYGAGFTFTNRWGIYQAGTSDTNYFAANSLFGTTVNAGFRVDINGTARVSGDMRINGLTVGKGNNTDITNTAVGNGALGVSTAVNNTALGCFTLQNNTTGIQNTALGRGAGAGNTTGLQNTYVGYNAGLVNTNGARNVLVGNSAGVNLNGGGANVFIGYQAGFDVTTGYNNIIIGDYAFSGIVANNINDNIIFGTSGIIKARMFDTGNWVFQNGGTFTDIASAQVAVNSTTKGFLPPRLSTTQKNAIATPAAGLVVYDTTLNKLCVYTTAWETITSI